MHSVNFYSFRVLEKKGGHKSYNLGELKNNNQIKAYDIIKNYIIANYNIAMESQGAKTVVSISSLNFDDNKKLIYGYVNVGKYGEQYSVRHKSLSQPKKFTVTVDDVPERARYVMLYLPDALDEGIIAIHSSDKISPRGVLFENIIAHFKAAPLSMEPRFRPLLHKNIPQYILESQISEIKAIGFKPHKDLADAVKNASTHIQTEYTIRNNASHLGKVKDYIGNGKHKEIVEILSDNSEKVKFKAEVNGRDVVYNIYDILGKGIGILLDDSKLQIDLLTGIPNLSALHDEIRTHTNDIISSIHNRSGLHI
ncbi:hypothetical protein [Serratia sp. (in: enterobacteria)]|uniref:hypothetical protein n=1 Tax=Serratia sp. (in: enterobacteria) TaxID=616 RepID=UPI0040383623